MCKIINPTRAQYEQYLNALFFKDQDMGIKTLKHLTDPERLDPISERRLTTTIKQGLSGHLLHKMDPLKFEDGYKVWRAAQ